MRLHFSNLLVEFKYLSLVVQIFLVKGLLLAEAPSFLEFEVTEFLLTRFAETPLKPHLIDLGLDLKVSVSAKDKVLHQLGKESLKLN